MNKNIKNIVFDLGGVLLNLDFAKAIEAFEKVGIKDVNRRIRAYGENNIFQQLEKGTISAAQFRKAIQQEANQPLTDQEIDALWNAMLLDIPRTKLELILELRGQYMVYLLSNTNEIHWEYVHENSFNLNGFHAHDYFDEVFLSYKMKLSKPDPEIFKKMMNEANILPEDTFFIDDSEENCKAAEALGIHTYHYHNGEDLEVLFE